MSRVPFLRHGGSSVRERGAAELPLVVGHGIFARVLLLDIVLGGELAAQSPARSTPDGKAELAIARREFRELTPGQRVEQAMVLSHELGKLAERGRRRARAERS